MAKDNKTHIGFFLNLDKPSDRAINQVLQTIPTYISKTSYIKRAIMFYKKYSNDNLDVIEENEVAGFNNDNIVIPSNNVKPHTNKTVNKKEKKEDEAVSVKDIKEEPQKTSDKPKKESGSKIEYPKEEEVKTPPVSSDNEDDSTDDSDIVINNNSDINEDVDYDSYINDFFK